MALEFAGRRCRVTERLPDGLVRIRFLDGSAGTVADGDIVEVGSPARTNTPVYEDDPDRTWTGEDLATDEQMNVVLEILVERGSVVQSELAEELGVRMELKAGTAAAATSASLLFFREAGWVEFVRREGRSRVWRLKEGS